MVDGGYTGNDFADQVKLILNAKTTVVKRNELHMFTVLPQRWIVERSWSWLDKCRRLWKNCERALNSSILHGNICNRFGLGFLISSWPIFKG